MEQGASPPAEPSPRSNSVLHWRAFRASVVWTLGLLLLGSIVHATESSLACPDWPTCYGSLFPEMSGGVFWEHLHRLVAGALVLLWSVGTWFAYRTPGVGPGIRIAAAAGVVLLLVQSLFGGLTVIMRLPDAISTTHLALAFLFLALATVLWVLTGPNRTSFDPSRLPWGTSIAALLVFLQSVLGAAVRHTDSGLACPDIPFCLGEWVPPLEQWPIALHYSHRVFALVVAAVVLGVALRGSRRTSRGTGVPRLLGLAVALVVAQVALGFLSVSSFLAVWAVSLHTLVAACLLAALVGSATLEASSSG